MKRLLLIMPLLLAVLGVSAQERRITGRVTEKGTGVPVIGASVQVQETKKGAATDVNGNFVITAETGQTIKISYLGFETATIKIGANDTNLSVSLRESAANLEAVVVTGYQSEKKKDIIGAVSVVNTAEVKQLPNANPIHSLQGKVPGITVYADGAPNGGNTNVFIRGLSSINGGANVPLYVIDGVPTKKGMHELNPNDIESIQVLKDASAASIYGARSQAGVIIITTKKAKKGETTVTANARNSFVSYNTRMNVLDAEGFGKAYWQASVNDKLAYNTDVKDSYYQGLYNFDWSQDANGNYTLNKINLAEYIDPSKTMKTANTNWFNEISQVGKYQTYDVSIAKGTDKGGAVFSVDYTDNDGIIKTTNFKRISGRVNSDYKLLNDRLSIGENFTAAASQANVSNVQNLALQALPVIPVHTVDGSGWGGPFGQMNDRHNPVRLLEDNKQNHYNYLRLLGNAFADLEIIKGLHARTNIGLDYNNNNSRTLQKAYVSGYLNNPTNYVFMDTNYGQQFTWTSTLNYKRILGKHNIDAIAGTEYYHEYNSFFTGSKAGFLSEDMDYTYINAASNPDYYKLEGSGGERSIASLFTKVNYGYNDTYLASVTLRRDGSSVFGKNNHYGIFPGFSLGWRLNNEKFVQENLPFISELKLRYGWGQQGGQDALSELSNKTLYQTNLLGGDPTWRTPDGTGYDFNGTGKLAGGFQLVQLSNDDLKWETVTQSNYGLDFGFLKDKLTGSVDYFVKKTTDMLYAPPYIAVIGEGGYRQLNLASLENKGLEFSLTYNGNLGRDLNFSFSGNIAGYRNKITDLPESAINSFGGDGLTKTILGHPIGSGFGYVADGLFRTPEEVANSAEQNGKGLGRIRYKDLNGDGLINQKDQDWILNPTPDFIYGLNFNIDYKAFDLSVFFQGVGNQDVNVYDAKSNTDFWSIAETGSNKGSRVLDAWTPSNPDSDIPALTLTNRNAENNFSTYFVENGAYLKLRNIQLGYTLPKKLAGKIKASNFNLYVSAQNLFTVKSKSFTGVDPEAAGYGYPIPRMITTGLRIGF